jgi:hypothetical protein
LIKESIHVENMFKIVTPVPVRRRAQVCQIFLDSINQNGEICIHVATKLPNGLTIYKLAMLYYKWPKNILTFSNARHSEIYPNYDFLIKNIPSGNPGRAKDCGTF